MFVPNLIDFYNNQNRLAVEVASQTASNQTTANLEGARLGAEAKRLDQEKQLEHYRTQMTLLRDARAQSAATDLNQSQMENKKQENILSQTFEGSQNAAKMGFQEKLQAMSEAGAQARQTQNLAAEAPLRQAQTAEAVAKTEIAGQPSPKDLIDTYVALQKTPDAGWFAGQDEKKATIQRKAILLSLETQLGKLGVDPTSHPDVLAAKAPQVAQAAKDQLATMDKFFNQTINTGKTDILRARFAELQAKVANGVIRPSNVPVAIARFKELVKSYNMKPEDFGL